MNFDYIEEKQVCKITAETPDKNWKQIRFQYSQITEFSETFENSIEIPWHVFIAHLQLLPFFSNLYRIQLTFTQKAKQYLDESIARKSEIDSIDTNIGLLSDEVEEKLNGCGFVRKLTPEQKRNIARLSRLPFGANFSVPGAGKTTEAIAFYLIHRLPEQKLLVICPKNAFPAWEEQFELCLKESSPRIKRLTNGADKIESDLLDSKIEVYLISYQQYIRVERTIGKFLHYNKSFVFIDESHRMKGGSRTDTGRQIQKIAHLPVGKLVMSGTPMPNSIIDLIPQYSFLFPTDFDVNENSVIGKIRKIYVRTTKKELGLGPISIIRTPIPMHEPQRLLYNLIRSEELRRASSIANNDKKLYRQLSKSYIRLLQIVSNPSLLVKSVNSFPDLLRETIEYGDCNKIRYIAIKARQLAKAGKKVIIWSGFVENIEMLTRLLSDLGAKCIHGGVEAGSDEEEFTREGIVKDFHDDPNMFVLVANPAACSEGISLHSVCHHAIYLDRNYNAAQFLQSMDRIHRLGLPKDIETIVELVHTPDSIDDLVDTRLSQKIARMADVLNDDSLHVEPVTVELDEDGFDEDDAKLLLRHLKSSL